MATTVPAPPHLIVDVAIEEIRRFAGEHITFYDAAALLPRWEHYGDLSPRQRAQVLRVFPGLLREIAQVDQ